MFPTVNTIFSMQTGKEFEDEFLSVIREKLSCKKSSEEDDRYQGTDLRIEGIPCDVTFFYSGKNYCQKVGDFKGWTLGIRTSNGHCRFKEPVLVIGMNCDAKFASQYVIPNMKKYIGDTEELANAISDAYWGWVDSHE